MHAPHRSRTYAGTLIVPDLADRFGFSQEARDLLQSHGTWRQQIELLAERFPVEAIRLLATLMPKRAAVWWGLLCAWEVHRDNPCVKTQIALAATLQWIQEPNERNRREAEAAGNAATLHTSAGCMAKAAFWSEGSMSLVGLPNVTPPAELTAQLAGSAVLLAGVEKDHAQVMERYRQFLHIGLQVASGKLLWSDAEQPAAETKLVEFDAPVTVEARERILHWPVKKGRGMTAESRVRMKAE